MINQDPLTTYEPLFEDTDPERRAQIAQICSDFLKQLTETRGTPRTRWSAMPEEQTRTIKFETKRQLGEKALDMSHISRINPVFTDAVHRPEPVDSDEVKVHVLKARCPSDRREGRITGAISAHAEGMVEDVDKVKRVKDLYFKTEESSDLRPENIVRVQPLTAPLGRPFFHTAFGETGPNFKAQEAVSEEHDTARRDLFLRMTEFVRDNRSISATAMVAQLDLAGLTISYDEVMALAEIAVKGGSPTGRARTEPEIQEMPKKKPEGMHVIENPHESASPLVEGLRASGPVIGPPVVYAPYIRMEGPDGEVHFKKLPEPVTDLNRMCQVTGRKLEPDEDPEYGRADAGIMFGDHDMNG